MVADGEVVTRIDWTNSGAFSGALDTVRVPMEVRISRGVNSDFSGEAIGSATLTFKNDDEWFTPDRNWADNPSFEYGTAGYAVAAITGLTAAATSVSQVTDNAPSAGTKAGEAVLASTLNSGVNYALPDSYRFRSGKTYAFSFYLRSMSGTTSVQCGIASSGTVSDIATAAGTITGSWAAYSGTWTPSADRTDAVLFVRTTAASAATVRIDRIQLNPGSALNTYLEAPTRGQLVPGRPVHIYGYENDVTRAKFFGYIERITPNSRTRTVVIECYDVLRRLSETSVLVSPAGDYARTPRDMRVEILNEYERGNVNLLGNPSFETNTTGWTTTGTSLTRITTDAAPGGGTACGELVTSAGSQQAGIASRLVPTFLAGETYRASVYLRRTSGSGSCNLEFGPVGDTKVVGFQLGTAWRRVTVSYTAATDIASSNPLFLLVVPSDATTIRIDNAAVTRGQPLWPYAATGTGRYPSFLTNGGFDGGLTDWVPAYANLITNGSFEGTTTGWSVAGDVFVSAPTSITFTADPVYGSDSGEVVPAVGAGSGVFFAITGTFKANVRYYFGAAIRGVGSTLNGQIGIGSNGTPADVSAVTNASIASSWGTELSGSWLPTADRTDVHFYVKAVAALSTTFRIDGLYVFREADAAYVDVGPGTTGGIPPTTYAQSTAQVKYGYVSLLVTPPATANVGMAVNASALAPYFGNGVPYTLAMWVYPTDVSFDYKIGLGANTGVGTYDEATATGTLSANSWQQISVTWTPSADRYAPNDWDAVGFVWRTEADADPWYVDGARLIAGSSVDDYELDQWSLATGAEGTDGWAATASMSGSALSALSAVNSLTLTRHWIRATMAAPWYEYVTDDRDTFAARASSATFDGDDIAGVPEFIIDRNGIGNVVGIEHPDSVTTYYSDEDSIEAYGVRPLATISGADIYAGSGVASDLGPAIITRFRQPRYRPVVQRVNDYANQLDLDLNDVVTLDADRALIRSDEYVIVHEELVIVAPRNWTTTWTLESFPH